MKREIKIEKKICFRNFVHLFSSLLVFVEKSYVSMPRNLADQNDQSISQDWADRDKFRGLVTSPALLSDSNTSIRSDVVKKWMNL